MWFGLGIGKLLVRLRKTSLLTFKQTPKSFSGSLIEKTHPYKMLGLHLRLKNICSVILRETSIKDVTFIFTCCWTTAVSYTVVLSGVELTAVKSYIHRDLSNKPTSKESSTLFTRLKAQHEDITPSDFSP